MGRPYPPLAPTLDDPTSVAPANTKPNGPKRGSIDAIIGAYKMSVSRRIQAERNGANIWQRNYYEQIIRNADDHNRIQFYIESNPHQLDGGQRKPREAAITYCY